MVTPFNAHVPLLPMGVMIFLVIVLIGMSAIFAGLTLGLMTLDPTELKVGMVI